jgi:hypothetical protein
MLVLPYGYGTLQQAGNGSLRSMRRGPIRGSDAGIFWFGPPRSGTGRRER